MSNDDHELIEASVIPAKKKKVSLRCEWHIGGPVQSIQRYIKPTAVCDLLCYLMHLCKQEKIDFNYCLARGQDHFEDELKHPEE